MMKAYITRYALTKGIYEVEGHIDLREPRMFCGPNTFQYFFGEGINWHHTLEAVKVRAEEMRKTKIASLQKQIAKLEKMKY